MNPETLLAFLPNSGGDALSLNEIALAMGLDTSSHTAAARTKRQLSRVLRALMKWGWISCDLRQGENGHKAWHNVYWRTELAKQKEEDEAITPSVD
jgi:hypothetical protein